MEADVDALIDAQQTKNCEIENGETESVIEKE